MSWYKEARALDPGMWQQDTAPHRRMEDHPTAWTPYGHVVQNQDQNRLLELYFGVHLTDSIEYAAVYANSKSSNNDPPVIIEIDEEGLEQLPDVDVAANTAFEDYVSNSSEEWRRVLNSEISVDEKAETLVSSIFDDAQFWEDDGSGYGSDVAEYVRAMHEGIPPSILSDVLSGKTSEQVVGIISDFFNNGIPLSYSIAVVRQFRVNTEVGSDRVVAIYQIDRFSDDFKDYNDEDADFDEEDEEDSDFEPETDNSPPKISREDLDYSWPELKEIYHSSVPHSGSVVYHGTSYARAKQAFPDLIR
jgi:hypothetical protein